MLRNILFDYTARCWCEAGNPVVQDTPRWNYIGLIILALLFISAGLNWYCLYKISKQEKWFKKNG